MLSSGGRNRRGYGCRHDSGAVCQKPTYCDATNITPHGKSVEFDERCTTKGDYIDEFHSGITDLGHGAIVLSRTPTKSDGGYLLRRISVISAATRPTAAFIEMVLKQIDEALATIGL
jgi:hypothetical protein